MNTPQATPSRANIKWLAPTLLSGLAFAVLFYSPATTLLRDWWVNPEAQHGLLLGPLALVLAWHRGLGKDREPQPFLGAALLVGAVLLRYASALAAELFTMRLSLVAALFALVVFVWGLKQALRWWLPFTLLILSIPLPQVVLSSLAFPLQIRASRLGAFLLEWRGVPVLLEGNIIHLPGQTLFVTEACSGLRSLTALVSLGVLLGALWLRHPVSRVLLLLLVLPIAMALNGVRVFLTGFLVFFVDPAMGEGFMHMSEGWGIFVVALLLTWVVTAGLGALERLWKPQRAES
ncbi:MAG: exosortase/archaeosortase family protein [Gemmatimonadetes bacterium]|nr:exosortase/archaeosortase family protein [Gemmatimonadota bacterium]NNM06138.1 exosortase/archaeosortase family protein [Gemmatimonadota bacterium]